mmetsp:Transcript_15095/g.40515  ORF Transcript_15095/g.40515 Transcript_15095/m.40515 type:complete len:242 (+) Transcript_15095:631-1356(+)
MLDALATARQVVVHLAPQHQGSQGEAASPMILYSLPPLCNLGAPLSSSSTSEESVMRHISSSSTISSSIRTLACKKKTSKSRARRRRRRTSGAGCSPAKRRHRNRARVDDDDARPERDARPVLLTSLPISAAMPMGGWGPPTAGRVPMRALPVAARPSGGGGGWAGSPCGRSPCAAHPGEGGGRDGDVGSGMAALGWEVRVEVAEARQRTPQPRACAPRARHPRSARAAQGEGGNEGSEGS